MKALSFKTIFRIVLAGLMIGGLAISGLSLYRQLISASKIDEKTVDSYRPELDTKAIKEAAERLK